MTDNESFCEANWSTKKPACKHPVKFWVMRGDRNLLVCGSHLALTVGRFATREFGRDSEIVTRHSQVIVRAVDLGDKNVEAYPFLSSSAIASMKKGLV